MLGHDVLNGILSVIAMPVNILVLQGPKIFKPLHDVQFIFGIHQVDLLLSKGLCELFIVRKTSPVFFGQQGIVQLFQILFFGTVIADDFFVEKKKNLIQLIGRQLADGAAKQISFGYQKYRYQIVCAKRPF